MLNPEGNNKARSFLAQCVFIRENPLIQDVDYSVAEDSNTIIVTFTTGERFLVHATKPHKPTEERGMIDGGQEAQLEFAT